MSDVDNGIKTALVAAGSATAAGRLSATDAVTDTSRLQAVWLKQPNQWMAGAINGKSFANDADRDALGKAVIDCLEPVNEAELPYSSCTDGRRRQTLLDEGVVPVREQLVGTDLIITFAAAEALAERFYGEGGMGAPVNERIAKVIDFLTAHGYKPTAHIGCGAAGGFLTVLNRATQFINDPAYVERLKMLLPEGVYDEVVHKLIVGGYQSRLDGKVYDGYRDGLMCEIVESVVGSHAVERFVDDGRGVHGHMEQAVVYLGGAVTGLALNPNKLADTYGLQVFMVNSARVEALARLFGDPAESGSAYRTARIAMEDFAAAGHGTLASGMETVILS